MPVYNPILATIKINKVNIPVNIKHFYREILISQVLKTILLMDCAPITLSGKLFHASIYSMLQNS